MSWNANDYMECADWNNLLDKALSAFTSYKKVNSSAPAIKGNYSHKSLEDSIYSYLPADINDIEVDIHNYSNSFSAKNYKKNGLAPDFNEINRIETEISKIYSLWTPSAKIQPRLAFRLSTSKLRF